eukprot:2274398-Rhodomonas_salina.1
MHATDLESGEFMEETEAAATQSAQHDTSEDGGAEQVRGFRDELGLLTEIMQNLKEPLKDVTASTTNWQLRKRVRDLEAKTGKPLGTDNDDVMPSERLLKTTKKKYSAWTHSSQVPLTAEIAVLKDQQLG